MNKNLSLLVCIVMALSLSACNSTDVGSGQTASARLEPRSDSNARGLVSFVWQGNDIWVTGSFSGLTPDVEQGFHIHEKGDCSASDASSAGGHFNPDGKSHGAPNSLSSHAGDMPNIKADSNGNAVYSVRLKGFTINKDANGIVGRSVVIHRDADDYKTQPAGNSGARIACGVIEQNY